MLDKNNDGVLSKEELREGLNKSKFQMTEQEINELFNVLDQNNNQTLDYTEFVAAAIDKKFALSDDKIKQCFTILDKNKDGTISVQEFRDTLQSNKQKDDQLWH